MAAAGSRYSSALWEWVRYLGSLLIYQGPRLQCITETLANSSLARRMILFLCVCRLWPSYWYAWPSTGKSRDDILLLGTGEWIWLFSFRSSSAKESMLQTRNMVVHSQSMCMACMCMACMCMVCMCMVCMYVQEWFSENNLQKQNRFAPAEGAQWWEAAVWAEADPLFWASPAGCLLRVGAPPLGCDFMGFNVRCCISWDEIITQWAARALRDDFFRVLASIVLQRMALS